jgi:probable F420-dependent oxidoreductase
MLGWAPAGEAREAAAEIDGLGYGALWVGESHSGKESFSHIGVLLAATRRIVVASGIANIWVRDATAMNAAANTLAEAYPGRFLLGLGVSHPPQIEHRGHEYRRPVAAMRSYLDAMEAAGYEGPGPPERVLRVLAALRRPMLELAREKADGAHPYFVPVEHTVRAREILGAGPLLAPEQAVLLETDPALARARAREHMAWYLTLPNYVENLRWLGYEDADFAGGGSDRLVDAIVAWGDEAAIQARVRAHLDAGADHVGIQPLAPGRGLGLDQLGRLAPALLAL